MSPTRKISSVSQNVKTTFNYEDGTTEEVVQEYVVCVDSEGLLNIEVKQDGKTLRCKSAMIIGEGTLQSLVTEQIWEKYSHIYSLQEIQEVLEGCGFTVTSEPDQIG